MPKIPFDDDDGRFEFAEPPELSEAAKQALARQQKLDDANFITERTLAFQRDMAAEFARAKAAGDTGDPMFVKDLMKLASEMRSEHLSDIPKGPGGRLVSPDAIDVTRANMEGAMERFQTAALHRLNLERHQKAFANIGAAGVEIAAAAKRDAKGLSGLLSTVDDLMGQFEGVFAADEAAEQRARLRAGAVTAAVDGLIERGKTGDARELIQKGGFDAELGPGAGRLLLGRIDMSEEDNAAKVAEEAAEARSAGVADLVVRVATGQVFPVEFEVALAQGTIGPEEHAGFLAEIERFKHDRARRIEGKERINDLLARRQKPDETDRAAVDAVFESLARAFAEHPPDTRALIEDDYVARTGMLPAALRDSLIGGMFSEDPAAQVAAAGRLVAFEDSDPALIVNLPANTLAHARMINAYAYPGLPPARSVQLAAEKMAQQEGQAETAPETAPETGVPDVPEKSADEGNSGNLPIIQATPRKRAVGFFQLTPEQKEKAQQTITIVDNEGADKLTREEKIAALKNLHSKPNVTPREMKVAIKIFSTFKIDPAFEDLEEPNRKRLLKQLPKDEIIKNAEKNWARLTPEEKLAALDRAVAIHATIFGTEKPKVRLKKLGLPGAQYDQRTNTITIDVSKEGGRFADSAFGNIMHEAAHAQQHQLATDFLDGKINPDDPRWLQAQIFALNNGKLYIRPTKPGLTQEGIDYSVQPVEKHAGVLGGRVERAFFELSQKRMKRELGR